MQERGKAVGTQLMQGQFGLSCCIQSLQLQRGLVHKNSNTNHVKVKWVHKFRKVKAELEDMFDPVAVSKIAKVNVVHNSKIKCG